MAQGISSVDIILTRLIKCDVQDASITFPLPLASESRGKAYKVSKVDDSENTVTITTATADKILTRQGEVNSITLTEQGDAVQIVSDGTVFSVESAS